MRLRASSSSNSAADAACASAPAPAAATVAARVDAVIGLNAFLAQSQGGPLLHL